MTYFYEWGVLQSRTDPNGLAEHFKYDAHGRRISRFTPYGAAIPAVSYEYSRGPNNRMTARTATKVTLDPADPSIIETLILIDGLDRPVQVEYPSSDGPAITAYSYHIENQQAITRVVDPEGSITETAMDPLGRITGITRGDPSSPLAKVSYTYDPISQLEQVIQHTPQGDYTVHFSYDLRGLQTQMTSPETGETVLRYDERGSLIEKSTPNLRSAGKVITLRGDVAGASA